MIREAGSAGLYIHIPFCKSKCVYCDFCSSPASEAVKKEYVSALSADLKSKTRDTRQITTVYVGGGTPSCLADGEITRILETVKGKIADGAEITVEVNPESFTPSKAEEYKNAGVNRISIGVQSTSDEVLRAAARRHDASSAIRELGKAGKFFDNVSADIMLGLPYQTVSSATESVLNVIPYVKHVSAYMLKLSDDVPMTASLRNGEYTLPDEDSVVDMYNAVYAKLAAHGFARYEISNFAFRGYESKHNLKYWRREEYLGFGAAAHSQTGDSRYANPASVKDYIGGKRFGFGTAEREIIDKDGEIFEHIMLGLRTSEGIDVAAIEKRYGFDFDERFSGALTRLSGILAREGDRLRIADDKLLLESAVALEFMD